MASALATLGDFWPASPNGFAARQIRSDDDFVLMRAVHDACRVRDRIDPHSVCYRLPNLPADSYQKRIRQHATEGNHLIVEKDGDVVAYAFMDAWGHDERLYLWRVWVTPRCRNIGLGTAMNRWGEALARKMHGSDQRVALHLANASEGESDAVALLRNEGHSLSFVSPELAFDDFHTLAVPDAIDGIELRPLDPDDHVAVARALCEANLNPPKHETRFAGMELQQRIDLEEKEWLDRIADADPRVSPVAWAGDTVTGAFLCRVSGVVGEISQVAVRAGWRGKGVARALCDSSLRGLQTAGCATARLFTSTGPDEVEPADGPYAMYRKFGFKPIARHLRFRKPMSRL